MRNELKALEDTILEKLSTSENPVDDIELIAASGSGPKPNQRRSKFEILDLSDGI